jgi:phage shock protein E
LLLSLVLITVGLFPSQSLSEDAGFVEEFTIKVGEKVTLDPGIPSVPIKIRFVRVPHEGRCPEGAQCILPGNAKVELKFKSSSRESLSVILNTDELPQQVEVPGVRVKLIKLTPHPRIGTEIDPNAYELTLIAERTSFLR